MQNPVKHIPMYAIFVGKEFWSTYESEKDAIAHARRIASVFEVKVIPVSLSYYKEMLTNAYNVISN